MRAWRVDDSNPSLHLAEVPEPAIRGGGVLIEVIAAHVPAYTDALPGGLRGSLPIPLTLGVSCVGRVLEVADDVFHVAPGDLVVDTALLSSGDAAQPEEILVGWTGIGGRGLSTPTTTAMQAVWRDGVFAERALVAKETLVRLPGADSYPDLLSLALLPWLTIAAEGVARAEVAAGQTVLVMGATGQLGSAAVLIALARGAGRVVAVGRNPQVLERLAALDRRVLPVPLTGSRAETAAAIVAAAGEVDAVLDTLGAVPTNAPTLAGYDSLRTGGTMVLVGGVRQDLPLPYADLMHRRLTVRGSWMATPATALAVWTMVRDGVVDLDVTTTYRVGLGDPTHALELAARTSGLDFVVLAPALP